MRRLTHQKLLIIFVFLGLSSLGRSVEFASNLGASLGRKLSPEEPETTLTFEPKLAVRFGTTGELSLSSAIERPLDPHENFRVPKTPLTWQSVTEPLLLFTTVNFIELDRWRVDGTMVRQSAGVEWTFPATPELKLPLRAGPFVQWNQYELRADGRSMARYGFFERLGVEYSWRRLRADLRLSFEQRYAGVWKNDIATYERVAYLVSDQFQLGAAHELLSSVVDETTGSSTPFALFDGRQSKLSVVAQWTW